MMNSDLRKPAGEDELCGLVADALTRGEKIALIGGGSKAGVGREVDARPVSMTGIAGIVDYDPSELVLTVKPGTPLAEIKELLAANDQMLAFEPFDYGPVFQRASGLSTIGGTVAAGVAGSLRLSRGGARDHLLGFRAVSGRGEIFAAGSKVVKNVTGFDLPKLAAASWGRLFAMTELTLKVSPLPKTSSTLGIEGLDPQEAVTAMALAAASKAEVAAAAHMPASNGNRTSLTIIRIDGFGPSVDARATMLRKLLVPHGTASMFPHDVATNYWTGFAGGAHLPLHRPLWRILLPPSAGPAAAATAAALGADWAFDWAGGLVWMAGECDPDQLRATLSALGGHATLMRGTREMRAAVPAFHPLPPGLAALEERVRRAFDPRGIFETGRF